MGYLMKNKDLYKQFFCWLILLPSLFYVLCSRILLFHTWIPKSDFIY